jgi:hypothetical protein
MCRSSVRCPSDLPGVNPATNDRMILYYCLNDQSGSVLGDSTVFSWAGCHSSFPKRGQHHRHAPFETARWAPPHAPPYHVPTSPPPLYNHTWAPQLTSMPPVPLHSPEPSSSRPPPNCAIEPPCWWQLCPNHARKSNLGDPRSPSLCPRSAMATGPAGFQWNALVSLLRTTLQGSCCF